MNERIMLSTPSDCMKVLSDLGNRRHEYFGCLLLDSSRKLLAKKTLFKGTKNRCTVEKNIVFYTVCKQAGCKAVILYHNHPHEALEPSSLDIDLTVNLKQGFDLLGFQLLDHIIVTRDGYYSFLENELILTGEKESKVAEGE